MVHTTKLNINLTLTAGVIAEKLPFALATTYISFAFLLQTVLVIWWCVVVYRVKRQAAKGGLKVSETSPLLEG